MILASSCLYSPIYIVFGSSWSYKSIHHCDRVQANAMQAANTILPIYGSGHTDISCVFSISNDIFWTKALSVQVVQI